MSEVSNELRYVKLLPELPDLIRGTQHSAGIDLYSAEMFKEVFPLRVTPFRTGVAVEIPEGFFGLVTVRSGLGKRGLVAHTGIIDSDYRGELLVNMFNIAGEVVPIKRFDRIAQLTILPYRVLTPVHVQELTETERGTGGFGSTGT